MLRDSGIVGQDESGASQGGSSDGPGDARSPFVPWGAGGLIARHLALRHSFCTVSPRAGYFLPCGRRCSLSWHPAPVRRERCWRCHQSLATGGPFGPPRDGALHSAPATTIQPLARLATEGASEGVSPQGAAPEARPTNRSALSPAATRGDRAMLPGGRWRDSEPPKAGRRHHPTTPRCRANPGGYLGMQPTRGGGRTRRSRP